MYKMNETEQKRFEDASDYIKEEFNDSGDSPWLEGWIVGFTDPENAKEGIDHDNLKENLFEFLRELRG